MTEPTQGYVPAWTVKVSDYTTDGWVFVQDADEPDRWRANEPSTRLVNALAPVRVVGSFCGAPTVSVKR